MGDVDDLAQAGTGSGQHKTFASLDAALERLDLLDALEDLSGGGAGGFATGIEIIGEQMAHSPYDDLLDAFEPVRDIADHTDFLDDIF
jgi:hypothetical protein